MNADTEFAITGEPFVNPAYDHLASDIPSESRRLVLDVAAHPDDVYLAYDEARGIDLRPYITTRPSWEAIFEEISQMNLDFRNMYEHIIDKFVEIPLIISTEELFDYSLEPDEDCDTSALKEFLDGIEVKND